MLKSLGKRPNVRSVSVSGCERLFASLKLVLCVDVQSTCRILHHNLTCRMGWVTNQSAEKQTIWTYWHIICFNWLWLVYYQGPLSESVSLYVANYVRYFLNLCSSSSCRIDLMTASDPQCSVYPAMLFYQICELSVEFERFVWNSWVERIEWLVERVMRNAHVTR